MRWIELNNEVMQKDSNGNYSFHKDKEAIKLYEEEYILPKIKRIDNIVEKLNYLVKNNYYDESVIKKYDMSYIEKLYTKIKNEKFKFASYMSINKFYSSYALKSDDGKEILETYEDKTLIVALTLANGNTELCDKLAISLIRQEFQPATPTYLNAGRKRAGEMVSCFLLTVEDSCEGISYAISSANHLSKIGGGVALNVNRLRARGEEIKGVDGLSGGVIGVAKMLEQSFNYFNQMGVRQGSGAIYISVLHPDCEEILDTKKINADEKIRLTMLSIGVMIPDVFMKKAELNQECYAFFPRSVYNKYGIHLDDMDMNEWYDKLANDDDIKKKKINPRKMLGRIAQTQQESGYPYVMYIDTANKNHTLKDVGKVKMSNLCCEIYQYQESSDIKGYVGDNVWGKDVSCNLGSLNIYNVMKNDDIEGIIDTSIRSLNYVAQNTTINEVPTVKNGNDSSRAIGLGAMNLHGYLMSENIVYGSKESIDFVRTFFSMIRYYSIKSSMQLSKETGKVFEGFEKSEYAKGENSYLFKQYVNENHHPKTEKVKQIFSNKYLPTKEDWKKLLKDVKENGIHNAYLMAIAPTQSISYVQNATSSIMPIMEQIEVRTTGKSTTIYPMPYLTNENKLWYRSAYTMDMKQVIDVVSEVQKHVDQGISTTLFVTSDKTTRDIAKLYIYAYKKGLKGLYYTRTKLQRDDTECISCSV